MPKLLLTFLAFCSVMVGQSTPSLLAPTAAVDFSGALSTKIPKSGTAPPGTCAVGETFFDTDATVGQNLYGCTSVNTWTLLGDGGGGGGGIANYETTFTTQTTVTVTGATHGFGHRKILVSCYDSATPRNAIGFSHTVDSTSFNVVITFATAQTGLCVLNGSGGAGDVTAAATFSPDNAIIRADGTGKGVQSSLISISDTGALTFPDGVPQIFNPNGTSAGLNVGSQAGDPSTPSNGDLWYDSTANELTARINGANVALGAGGGGITSLASQTGATQTITRGAGIGGSSATNDHSFTTASGEADFLASGALTCGASTQGKIQVHTTPLQYCDNAGTPALQYAAYGSATGESTAAANNSVALGTDTVNDYIASLSNGTGLTGFPAAGETATGTVAFDFSQTLAGNPAYNAKECVFTTEGASGGGFLCEGSTGGNTNEQLYLFPALDGVDTTKFIAIADSSPSTVGQVLRVIGTGLAEWGALDLADTDAVTGLLPDGNIAASIARDSEVSAGYQPLDAALTALAGGSDFVAFSGPAASIKTFTLPNASATVLTSNDLVTVAQGGTGIGTGTSGGVPYFSASTTIASSAALAASTIVLGGGAGAAPTTGAGYTVSTAGSAGTNATNMGTATALARQDHEHLVPWQVGMFFEATPSTGEFAMPLPVNNQCGGSINVNSVSITALTKGTADLTFNAIRYNNAGVSQGNLFSATQTYDDAGNNRQDASPNQNNTNIGATDFFRFNVVTINGQDDFSVQVQGTCKNK